MKKEELLNILNKAADSISLHDSSLINFNHQGSNLTFHFCIGEYHYLINHLEKYVDKLKKRLILSLTFNGVKNLKVDLDNNFLINNCEIISNDSIENTYVLKLIDIQYYGEISFSYENFSWDIIKE